MEVLILILPIALVISLAFVLSFIFAVKKGQYDDMETPAHRILIEEKTIKNKKVEKNNILGD